MKSRFQGDPRLFQGVNGSYLLYKAGQPVMDQGTENAAEIPLLTAPGWVGNYFLAQESQVGSGFIDSTKQPITITALNDIRQEGEKALDSDLFGSVTATITNPTADRIDAVFDIKPPGQNTGQITLTGSGSNWISQAAHPAHKEIE